MLCSFDCVIVLCDCKLACLFVGVCACFRACWLARWLQLFVVCPFVCWSFCLCWCLSVLLFVYLFVGSPSWTSSADLSLSSHSHPPTPERAYMLLLQPNGRGSFGFIAWISHLAALAGFPTTWTLQGRVSLIFVDLATRRASWLGWFSCSSFRTLPFWRVRALGFPVESRKLAPCRSLQVSAFKESVQ